MKLSATKYSWLMKSKNPSKTLEIQVGGESYALQIQMGGVGQRNLGIQVEGEIGGQKNVAICGGGGIFSGITQFEN